MQGFPAPERWAKVALNGDVSSICRTRGCESSKQLRTAANEPTLSLLLKVSHLHVSKYESLLSLKRMVCLLSSAESPVLCLSNRLLQSDVGPHLLDSSATLKFLRGGLVLGSESNKQLVS